MKEKTEKEEEKQKNRTSVRTSFGKEKVLSRDSFSVPLLSLSSHLRIHSGLVDFLLNAFTRLVTMILTQNKEKRARERMKERKREKEIREKHRLDVISFSRAFVLQHTEQERSAGERETLE